MVTSWTRVKAASASETTLEMCVRATTTKLRSSEEEKEQAAERDESETRIPERDRRAEEVQRSERADREKSGDE